MSEPDAQERILDDLLILVVEDDHLIQHLAEQALGDGGYRVEAASSAEQAIERLDAPNSSYRALVTDVNLGSDKLTGWDVARRARELAPDLPVVYMTAENASEWSSQGVPNSLLLSKPFAPAQLFDRRLSTSNRGLSARVLGLCQSTFMDCSVCQPERVSGANRGLAWLPNPS
jgi:CheY-like chemotaxis protein